MKGLGTKGGLSAQQVDALCTFMENNPEVVKGYKKTTKCIDAVQYKWKKITPCLNSLGSSKDHRSWAKYLCNIKAKLKRKNIQWSKSIDETRPIICNVNDFNEIELRMISVLYKHCAVTEDFQDTKTSCIFNKELEDNDSEKNCDTVEHTIWHEISKPRDKITYIKLPESNSLLLHTSTTSAHTDSDDEFDTFGKNIAQQLRSLPLPIALESQEMLLSVLRKQRIKVLTGT